MIVIIHGNNIGNISKGVGTSTPSKHESDGKSALLLLERFHIMRGTHTIVWLAVGKNWQAKLHGWPRYLLIAINNTQYWCCSLEGSSFRFYIVVVFLTIGWTTSRECFGQVWHKTSQNSIGRAISN